MVLLFLNCWCFFFLMIRRPPRSTLLTHSFPTRRSSDLSNIGSLITKNDEGMGVDLVDVTSGSIKIVEKPRRDAVAYPTDGNVQVRVRDTHGAAGQEGRRGGIERVCVLHARGGERETKATVNPPEL